MRMNISVSFVFYFLYLRRLLGRSLVNSKSQSNSNHLARSAIEICKIKSNQKNEQTISASARGSART